MIKISDVVRDIIQESERLSFGVSNGLFNLTQLAKFIQPMVEVRTQKEVKTSAILMSLSRLQLERTKARKSLSNFQIENVTIQSNLLTITFYKNETNEKLIQKLHQFIKRRNGYFGLMEGMNEYTVVFEQRFEAEVTAWFTETPKYKRDSIAVLVVKFPKAYSNQAGFLYSVLRVLAFQNINVVEAASTYSEFSIYIDRKDIQIAFDSLEKAFVPR